LFTAKNSVSASFASALLVWPIFAKYGSMPAKKWRVGELHLLGKRQGAELARRFGRSNQAVVTKRCLLGIPLAFITFQIFTKIL
jgi:hypothetical protein